MIDPLLLELISELHLGPSQLRFGLFHLAKLVPQKGLIKGILPVREVKVADVLVLWHHIELGKRGHHRLWP